VGNAAPFAFCTRRPDLLRPLPYLGGYYAHRMAFFPPAQVPIPSFSATGGEGSMTARHSPPPLSLSALFFVFLLRSFSTVALSDLDFVLAGALFTIPLFPTLLLDTPGHVGPPVFFFFFFFSPPPQTYLDRFAPGCSPSVASVAGPLSPMHHDMDHEKVFFFRFAISWPNHLAIGLRSTQEVKRLVTPPLPRRSIVIFSPWWFPPPTDPAAPLLFTEDESGFLSVFFCEANTATAPSRPRRHAEPSWEPDHTLSLPLCLVSPRSDFSFSAMPNPPAPQRPHATRVA